MEKKKFKKAYLYLLILIISNIIIYYLKNKLQNKYSIFLFKNIEKYIYFTFYPFLYLVYRSSKQVTIYDEDRLLAFSSIYFLSSIIIITTYNFFEIIILKNLITIIN